MTGIGIDGCGAGWLALRIDPEGEWTAEVFSTVHDLHDAWYDPSSLALIDIPIGLPDSESCRTCDAAARGYLGGKRASSVFNPPARAALHASDYLAAADLNQQATGKRISKQTFAILPKIREVDSYLRGSAEARGWMREVHPETLFKALNRDVATDHRKSIAAGREERLRILGEVWPAIHEAFDECIGRYRRKEVQADDILDAAAAALVAWRWRNNLRTLPADPPQDSEGLPCEMVIPHLDIALEAAASPEVKETVGSQKLLQSAVETVPEVLLGALVAAGAVASGETVRWVSPVVSDGYREYRDSEALARLGVSDRMTEPLSEFWPARGPVWDGLAIVGGGVPLLVEAKAHIPEMRSGASRATSERSVAKIARALEWARKGFAPRSSTDWNGPFYQYANRLAHHFFLRSINGIESRLVFLYFINAREVGGPASVDEWKGAIRLLHSVLGLPEDLSSEGVFKAFVDAEAVTHP